MRRNKKRFKEPTPPPVVEVEPDYYLNGRRTKKEEPIELSEEKVMGTKFTMSLQTLEVAVIASGIGGYYMLLQDRGS